jgi:iron complex transport system ATP-binding protein
MLEVSGLRVSYGDRSVLRGIDLTVPAGKVVGLVGRNGCGKSTLLKAVSQLIPRDDGIVRLAGLDASTMSRRELARRVAAVPQNPSLPVGYTAVEVVLMGRTPHLEFLQQEGLDDRRRALDALERVGCADLTDRRVDELSGGERQNVVLARALAQDTPILLLDEPTAHLDVGHQIAVFRLVRELAQETGLAVLAAIHDLTLAALYCDSVALMHEGRIVASGPPQDVLTTDNIAMAYGAYVRVLRDEAIVGPIIVPAS